MMVAMEVRTSFIFPATPHTRGQRREFLGETPQKSLWICLDFLCRIEPYQGVALTPRSRKYIRPPSTAVKSNLRLLNTAHIRSLVLARATRLVTIEFLIVIATLPRFLVLRKELFRDQLFR